MTRVAFFYVFLLSSLCTYGLDISITTSSCMPNNCTSTIQNALNQCNARPNPATDLCTITLQPGVFILHTENGNPAWRLTFNNGQNVRFTGNQQAEIQIDAYSQPAGLFLISNGKNLTFDGFTVDFVRVPFSYGQAINVTPDAILKIDQSIYPFPNSDQAWLHKVQAIMEYDPTNQRPAVHALDDYMLDNPASCDYNTSQSTLHMQGGNYGMVQGRWYILRHQVYSFQILDFSRTTNAIMRDITIYAAAGMGSVSTWGNGITVERMKVLRRGNRAMSICADGLHFQLCTGDIRITDSYFEGQGDDAINVPGHYQQVIQKVGLNQIVVAGRDQTPTAIEANVGDTLRFRNRDTFQPYFDTILASVSGTTATLRDNLPAQFKVWDLVLDQTAVPRSLLIQNNTFKNNRARGVLVKVANTLITNNIFDHNSGPAVLVDPDGCYWFEGDVVTNWTVESNTIIDVNYGPGYQNGDIWMAACHPNWNSNGTPSTNGNPVTTGQVFTTVTIKNNKVTQDMGQQAFTIYGVNTLVATGNSISYGSQKAASNIYASNSINTSLTGNTCFQNGSPVNCVITTPS